MSCSKNKKIRMTTAFKTHSGLKNDNQPNGPFQQQLENALHAGSKDAIRSWVTKTLHRTSNRNS